MDDRSDKNLVDASCSGNRKAYACLVNKYYRHVFMVCMSILGNVADAEDITQDAMLKGFLDIRKLRDGCQFGPWVTRIAKNMCINLVRRNKHSKKAFEEKAKQQNETAAENDRLQLAVEKLPRESRTPLIMYYFESQTIKTIAARMNISVPGVYLKLRAATEQLHELLVKQGDKNE